MKVTKLRILLISILSLKTYGVSEVYSTNVNSSTNQNPKLEAFNLFTKKVNEETNKIESFDICKRYEYFITTIIGIIKKTPDILISKDPQFHAFLKSTILLPINDKAEFLIKIIEERADQKRELYTYNIFKYFQLAFCSTYKLESNEQYTMNMITDEMFKKIKKEHKDKLASLILFIYKNKNKFNLLYNTKKLINTLKQHRHRCRIIDYIIVLYYRDEGIRYLFIIIYFYIVYWILTAGVGDNVAENKEELSEQGKRIEEEKKNNLIQKLKIGSQ